MEVRYKHHMETKDAFGSTQDEYLEEDELKKKKLSQSCLVDKNGTKKEFQQRKRAKNFAIFKF